jgi:hypothetical protein
MHDGDPARAQTSTAENALRAALRAELAELPADMRAVVEGALAGLGPEEVAGLTGLRVPEVRRLRDCGTDRVRRGVARRGLAWDPERSELDWDPPAAATAAAAAAAGAPARDPAAPLVKTVCLAAGVLFAVLLFLLGGGRSDLRASGAGPADPASADPASADPASADPAETVTEPPVLLAPLDDWADASTVFRWRPSRTGGGGDGAGEEAAASADGVLAQVILYEGTGERLWTTGPLTGTEVTIPAYAFATLEPGDPCLWRVREVHDGAPRASSGIGRFTYGTAPGPGSEAGSEPDRETGHE